MLLLLQGEVRTYLLSEEGREITLFRLYAGDSCVLSASCVIIWDDDGRKLRETDPATPMYYNKDGGKKYHASHCSLWRDRGAQ